MDPKRAEFDKQILTNELCFVGPHPQGDFRSLARGFKRRFYRGVIKGSGFYEGFYSFFFRIKGFMECLWMICRRLYKRVYRGFIKRVYKMLKDK